MSIKKMAEILSTQLLLLEKLQIVMTQETRALSEVDLEELSKSNKQKEELSEEIEIVGATIRQIMSEQATVASIPAASTLGAIAEAINSPDISELHQSLNLIAAKVKSTAVMNREIAERFAETTASNLNILTTLINQSNVYGASGSYQQRPTGSIIINREA